MNYDYISYGIGRCNEDTCISALITTVKQDILDGSETPDILEFYRYILRIYNLMVFK